MPGGELPDGQDQPDPIGAAKDEEKSRSASKASQHHDPGSERSGDAVDKEEEEQVKEERKASIEQEVDNTADKHDL